MDKYTIRCSEQQTRKALELGAPIDFFEENDENNEYAIHVGQGLYAIIPTTEQMINWLEDGFFREVNVQEFANYWEYSLYTSSDDVVDSHIRHFRSRKEATLAAIDAALNYLINQKTNSNKD